MRIPPFICAITISACTQSTLSTNRTLACGDAPGFSKAAPAPKISESFKAKFPSGTQTRTDEEINRVFESAEKSFVAIYEAAARRNPCIAGGTVYGAIAIRPDGSVAGVQTFSNHIDDILFLQTISDRIRLLQFPPAKGEALHVIRYPMRFDLSKY